MRLRRRNTSKKDPFQKRGQKFKTGSKTQLNPSGKRRPSKMDGLYRPKQPMKPRPPKMDGLYRPKKPGKLGDSIDVIQQQLNKLKKGLGKGLRPKPGLGKGLRPKPSGYGKPGIGGGRPGVKPKRPSGYGRPGVRPKRPGGYGRPGTGQNIYGKGGKKKISYPNKRPGVGVFPAPKKGPGIKLGEAGKKYPMTWGRGKGKIRR